MTEAERRFLVVLQEGDLERHFEALLESPSRNAVVFPLDKNRRRIARIWVKLVKDPDSKSCKPIIAARLYKALSETREYVELGVDAKDAAERFDQISKAVLRYPSQMLDLTDSPHTHARGVSSRMLLITVMVMVGCAALVLLAVQQLSLLNKISLLPRLSNVTFSEAIFLALSVMLAAAAMMMSNEMERKPEDKPSVMKRVSLRSIYLCLLALPFLTAS